MPNYTIPYAPNQSYVPNGRLVDLIRAQGQDAARSAEIRGQNSANLWNTVGQSIQQGVGAVTQAVRDAPKLAMERAAVKNVTDLQAGQQEVDRLMQGDTLPPGQEGPREQSYLGADGLFDIQKLNQALSAGGRGHLAPDLLKGAESINDSIIKHQQIEQQAGQLQTVMIGDIANGALTLAKSGGLPVLQAMDIAVQPAIATKRISEQQYAQVRSRIGSLPPDQQQAALTTFMDAAAKIDKGETLADKSQRVDRYGRVLAENVGEAPAPSKARFAAILSDQKSTPEQRDAAQKALDAMAPPKAAKSLQRGSVLLDGKPSEVLFDPDPEAKVKVFTLNGDPITDAATRVKPVPPASVQINNAVQGQQLPTWATDPSRPTKDDGNKFDSTIGMTPNGLYQAAINYIQDGKFPPTGMGSSPRAQAQRSAVTSKVGAIAAESGLDEPTLRAVYRANAGSLNQQQKFYDAAQAFLSTADKNSELLEGVLSKIPDMGSPFLNQPLRSLDQKALGSVSMSQFKTYLQSVQNEYAKILTQPTLSGQLTDSARKEAEQLVSGDATVAQIIGSLQALRNEGGNRLVSIGDQIQRIQKRMQNSVTPATTGAPKEGDTKPIDGFPGTEQTFKGGKWIRTK